VSSISVTRPSGVATSGDDIGVALDHVGPDRRALLVEVAELYYVEERSQQEVARILRMSRSKVSRLLAEGRDAGVVEIRINRESIRAEELERQLSGALNMPCRVVRHSASEGALRAIGSVAARRVERLLKPGGVLSLTHGSTVYETVRSLRLDQLPGLRIAQMAGFEVGNPLTDGWQLIRLCFDRIDNRFRYIHAPLIVASDDLYAALINDPVHDETMRLAREAEVALIGVGTVDPDTSSLARAGHLDQVALANVRDAGSVGAINGYHYRIDGSLIPPLNQRIIGLVPTDLSPHTVRLLVAGGAAKAMPIIGASRAGFGDELVTDTECATEILRLLAQERAPR
jgi:deoxyribonucleoside regulator